MTTLEALATIGEAVTEAINASGLKLEPAAILPDLSGNLTSAVLEASDGSSTKLTVATVTEVGIEVFDVANEAVQGLDLGLTPGEPTTNGSVAELDTIRHGEVSYHTITHGGHPIGCIVIESDRRSGEDEGAEETPTDATASPADAAAEYAPQNFFVPPSQRLDGAGNLTMLSDVKLNVTVELGRQSLTLSQVLSLTIGSVVELDRTAGAPVDIRVNGILFGRGEVVVVDNEYAVRIIEILENPGN